MPATLAGHKVTFLCPMDFAATGLGNAQCFTVLSLSARAARAAGVFLGDRCNLVASSC